MNNQSLVEKWRVAEARLATMLRTNSLYPHMREIGDRLAYVAVSSERTNPLLDKDREEVRRLGRAAGQYLSAVKATRCNIQTVHVAARISLRIDFKRLSYSSLQKSIHFLEMITTKLT